MAGDRTSPELLFDGIAWLPDWYFHGNLPEVGPCVREMLPAPAKWGSIHGYAQGTRTTAWAGGPLEALPWGPAPCRAAARLPQGPTTRLGPAGARPGKSRLRVPGPRASPLGPSGRPPG